MIFLSRRPRGPGRFLDLKVQFFFAGAAVLLLGMALRRDALVGFALVILVAGFALRFFERDEGPPDADADAEDGDDDGVGEPADAPRGEPPPHGPPDERS
ncbi:MAG TPA: hypothetical protein VF746_21440 [Longimicrobium sp.]|jgi:hypothetical protein